MDITEQITKAVALEPPFPFTDGDGVQRTDRNGKALYKIKVAFVGGGDARASVETIKTTDIIGEYEPLAEVVLDGIAFKTWSYEGKSGVSWTAHSVVIGDGAA